MPHGRSRILVAEDDPSVRFTLQILLEGEGFEVILASNGEQALETARREQPDLILLDQVMPKMDGKEVLGELRRESTTSGIPVFVLTGMEQVHSNEWPDTEFVGKPFDPDTLLSRIKETLGR